MIVTLDCIADPIVVAHVARERRRALLDACEVMCPGCRAGDIVVRRRGQLLHLNGQSPCWAEAIRELMTKEDAAV